MAEFPKYIRIDVVGPDENGHVNAVLTPDDNVKPVVTAEWKNDSDGLPTCTNCGEIALQRVFVKVPHLIQDVRTVKSKFCPECGAKMRTTNDRPYNGGTDSSTPLRSAQNDDGGEGD